jgi:hypothetical protein
MLATVLAATTSVDDRRTCSAKHNLASHTVRKPTLADLARLIHIYAGEATGELVPKDNLWKAWSHHGGGAKVFNKQEIDRKAAVGVTGKGAKTKMQLVHDEV